MKKFFLVCFVLWAGILSAQVPHPIDTIIGQEATYMSHVWFDSVDCIYSPGDTCYVTFGKDIQLEVANYYNTETPVKVAGIAAVMLTCRDPRHGMIWTDSGDYYGGFYYTMVR